MSAALPLRHFFLALAVVAVWGSNFAVIRVALDHLPPLLFAALRFALAVLPALLFVRRPQVGWLNLAAYGVLIGVGQFGLLYVAMHGHISPGLASLVIQTQVFFTIAMAMVVAQQKLSVFQWVAMTIAAAGMGVIVAHTDGTTSPLGLALVLLAALSWATGNMVSKQAGQVNMLAYVVWSSLFAVPPLLLLSWAFEGWERICAGIVEADLSTWLAVAWQSWGNSLFGYAAWGWLLARYPVATVTPMALLVPLFGLGASAAWLGEPLPAWKLLATALVMAGLALNLLWPRWRLPAGQETEASSAPPQP